MALRLSSADPRFAEAFRRLLSLKRDSAPDLDAAVREVIRAVRAEGDAALLRFTRQWDGADLGALGIRVSADEIAGAYARVDGGAVDALRFAASRIRSHHERQVPSDDRYRDALGAELGHRWTAIEAVGLYVPGGMASYPSSVLMNAIPAQVAGVPRVVMTVPAPGGAINPLVLVAADLAGVSEILRLGGAQAIAALAFGTETVRPVAKIVGPGNAYVAAAKRQVFGVVGIDTVAGPSEVLVVADRANDPDWIAADLLAQAEHDPAAQSILLTDDENFAASVEVAVERQLARLPREAVAGASWRDFGAVIVVGDLMAEAPPLIDALAAEHLELAVDEPEALLGLIRNAGAVFLGRHTPEAIGDYVAGSNHVLPTARAARFSSGLGVLDFMKRTSLLKLDAAALRALAPAAVALAEAEGLEAHARSVTVRLNL